jgi:hypothetical protein
MEKPGLAMIALIIGMGITDAAAAPVTYRCPDGITFVIDTARHKFAWINAQGVDETSTQGGVRFEGRYVTYGLGQPQPVRVDTVTGHVVGYSTGVGRWFEGGTCSPSRAPRRN